MKPPEQTRAEIMAADLDHVIEHMRPMRKELEGARIFITGGTGFIGCWLLESLAWANDKLGLGAEALVLTRNVEAFARKAPHLARRADIRFQAGDVKDFAFPEGQFSHVIHAATEASYELDVKHPEIMLDTIVIGTRHTLDFARERGAKKFLLMSSGAVYGPATFHAISCCEDYTGAPDIFEPESATYPEGKRMSELLGAIYTQPTWT
jgi:nucleoside-diphosphate-sugar epimerase